MKKRKLLKLAMAPLAAVTFAGAITTSFVISNQTKDKLETKNQDNSSTPKGVTVSVFFHISSELKKTVKVKPGSKFYTITNRPVVKKEGFDLKGWTLTEDSEVLIQENYELKTATDLYPVFVPQQSGGSTKIKVTTPSGDVNASIESLCGTGDILDEDGNPISARDAFDYPITIGADIVALPDGFLQDCTAFNKKITFEDSEKKPSKLFQIGANFLSGCTAFNNGGTTVGASTFTFPTSVKRINGAFLEECTTFNQNVDISNVTDIGDEFMFGCTSFGTTGSSLILPASTSEISVNIGDYFLAECTGFNTTIDLSRVKTIGDSFLQGCIAFNQNISFPSTIEKVGDFAMYRCDGFTATLTIDCDLTVLSGNYLDFAAAEAGKAIQTTGFTFASTTGITTTQFKEIYPDKTDAERGCYRTVH